MSYDMQIFQNIPGSIQFEIPLDLTDGTSKLLQRVVIILFADNGELIQYTNGSANTRALTEDVLIRETARVAEVLQLNTTIDTPDSEILDELVLSNLNAEGSSARINIAMTAVNSDMSSIIFNL